MALRIEELDQDRDLVERCQSGDRAAFDDLYVRHRDRLRRYCAYRLGDTHEAEDVVHETYLRAWKALDRFGGDRLFYPWLRTIAANLCSDVLRRRGRLSAGPVPEVFQLDPDMEALERASDTEMLLRAMERLTPRHRLALDLRERESLSYEEIADRTGVTSNTVASLLWRAREALRREFAAVGGEGSLVAAPLLVRLLRAGAGAKARLAEWAARLGPIASSSPALAAVIGSAVAATLSLGPSGASAVATGPVRPVALVRVASPGSSALAPAPVTSPTPPAALAATPSTSTSAGSTPSGARRRDVRTGYTAAVTGAQGDPVTVSAGGVTLGVNPSQGAKDVLTAVSHSHTAGGVNP